jgi:hypothetical protein
MKNCQTCGTANSEDMRFCVQCGKPLPDAPIVFNLQDSGSQPGPGTNPYGQSQPTNFGQQGAGQQPNFGQQPNYQPGFQPQQFSMVPPPKRGGGGGKMLIIVGGVFALIALVVIGVAGIAIVNLMKDSPVTTNSPTPTASPTSSPASSPKSTSTPRKTETPTEKSTTDARATVGKIWVDFNVKEGGRNGMRIHTEFTVFNLKGEDLYLALYFMKADDTPLSTTNSKYSSSEGQVALFSTLKPGFDETYYQDVKLFIPYDEFRLPKGKYDLKIDASVIYKAGGRVDHLDYYTFEYEKF